MVGERTAAGEQAAIATARLARLITVEMMMVMVLVTLAGTDRGPGRNGLCGAMGVKPREGGRAAVTAEGSAMTAGTAAMGATAATGMAATATTSARMTAAAATAGATTATGATAVGRSKNRGRENQRGDQ